MNYKPSLFLLCLVPGINIAAEPDDKIHRGEDMVITTGHKSFPNTTIATPSFNVSKEDLDKTNVTSAEDIIRMAPSVQVRRRFYGDTNGVTAIRGSTNFQTNHFNMYVDGLPLHNPVQTKWNGAPKWNLIAPNALESATVFYGPYSAEHKGSFGGTFDLKTRLPEKFEMSMEATGIIQPSRQNGQPEEVLTGHKEFISAGNRFGDWTVFAFYNHLENEGQPQSFATSRLTPGVAGTAVSGAWQSTDEFGVAEILTADLGINNVITDLYELKISYDFNEDLRALFTIALEDTEKYSQARTYLKDAAGNPFWGFGTTVNQNGQSFTANPVSRFTGSPTLRGSENERKTLAYGLNLSGKLTENWDIDTTASFFDAFKDVNYTTDHSRNNPAFAADKSGTIVDNEIWWADYSIKLATQKLFDRDEIGFMAGYQFNHSFLDIDQFASNDVPSGAVTGQTDSNGGSTQTNSFFMQTDIDFLDDWNVLAGFRYDHWSTSRGHRSGVDNPDRDASRVSPKASLSYMPTNEISFRYSFSKAYRFPVAEELFDSSRNAGFANVSDPSLSPESGYFHDFKIRYELDQGFASVSLFYNEIENEILRTQTVLAFGSSNRTRNIDKTETIGLEFIYQQDYIFDFPIGFNFNATWLNKEIKEDLNTPSNVGNEWIRIPRWRANGTFTYHTLDNWDNIVAFQFRSKQHNSESNADTVGNVYGGSSEYLLVNLKSAYKMPIGNGMTAKFSVGIDNLLNEKYFEAHPYPQRTYFATIGLDI